MNIPKLKHPELYQGFYLFDFGAHVAVGYTAEEISVLLAAPEHRGGTAYRIHHADSLGQFSLRGVSSLDVAVEEAMIFFRRSTQPARDDYQALIDAATVHAPPSPLYWHLFGAGPMPYPDFTVLIYPAVHQDAVGRWLQQIRFNGGDHAEGGPGAIDYFRNCDNSQREHVAIAPHPAYHSRPPREVLARVHDAVQRELGPA